MVFPLLSYILLTLAAFVLRENPGLALYIVGSGMMLLLLVGIRNAWDMVTFLAVERSHSHHDHGPDKRSGSGRRETRMPK